MPCRARIAWGAQNLSQHDKGAFTGEVSAAMLLDFGCKYVLVGHSERRAMYGEDDATVAAEIRGGAEGWSDADPVCRRNPGRSAKAMLPSKWWRASWTR